jgi:hypothetical protein
VAADLVLDAVRLVLELIDLLAAARQVLGAPGDHVLEERQHRPRTGDGGLHVLLHGPDRRTSEEIPHQGHARSS